MVMSITHRGTGVALSIGASTPHRLIRDLGRTFAPLDPFTLASFPCALSSAFPWLLNTISPQNKTGLILIFALKDADFFTPIAAWALS